MDKFLQNGRYVVPIINIYKGCAGIALFFAQVPEI
jgi:lantibiotic modifying enzyme